MSTAPEWIAADWGTSHLRAWAIAPDGTVLDHATSADGMGRLAPIDFEPALLRLAGAWLDGNPPPPVIACGMVGARQGWVEAAYRPVPCLPVLAGGLTRVAAEDARLDVRIVPGLSQQSPPDVMRGEETQIAGFLADTSFEGTICLPGTHTKWVTIAEGAITNFKTILTGEIFALLSEQSVLRHALGAGWDNTAFLDAVARSRRDPACLTGELFAVRARSLLSDVNPDSARSTLSGLLIGAELAAVSLVPGPVAIVGDGGAGSAYRAALESEGRSVIGVDAEQATLRGLTQAYHLHRGMT